MDVSERFEQTCRELVARAATAFDEGALVGLRNQSGFGEGEGVDLDGSSGNGLVQIALINGWVPQIHTMWYRAKLTGNGAPALHQLLVEMRSGETRQHAAGGLSNANGLTFTDSEGVNDTSFFTLSWNNPLVLSGGEGGSPFLIRFVTANLPALAFAAFGVSWSYRRVLPATAAPGAL